MDQIDQQILNSLKSNSRLTNKEIGEAVHLTGQAVGNRIIKLQEEGLISAFSVNIHYPNQQFIMVYMDSNQFKTFEAFINSCPEIDEFYKVAGRACYLLKSHFSDDELKSFLEELTNWGRYNIESILKRLK
ncbi:Lrp/AsnC family transcriptional regulator [Streptococcus dentapri]|uniref:Lrp/AsnC family transcriptional regulator n=1 Tax=Streptococcus dentapri TaxID=573564 RepID=A0ABV8D162_9STRE